MEILFCSTNDDKYREFKSILSSLNPCLLNKLSIKQVRIETDEIQADAEQICEAKCIAAYAHFKLPVIVEDTSLGFKAWHGLPGPYIKDFMQKLGVEKLGSILKNEETQEAVAYTHLAYWDGKGKPIVVSGATEGIIVTPRGSKNFGWDSIFQPKGYNQTYAEMNDEKHKISHRFRAINNFVSVMEKHLQNT